MNKKLITALLITSTALNASTLIAPGVHLESERTWVTGQGTGFVVENKDKELLGAFVTAQTSSVYGARNQNIMLSGSHSVSINNISRNSERYTTMYKICSNTSCTRQERTFSIDPRHDYTTSATTYLTTTFAQVGSYDIEATTEIHGAANASDTARGTAIISR